MADPTLVVYGAILTSSLSIVLRQLRLRAREREDAALVRHVFDQTRAPSVLSDLAALRQADWPKRRRDD